jgi:SP family myo-inositol transporter-like MFS transporter 13
MCYPETAGLSLEEISEIFKSDFGIAASERLRREKEARSQELNEDDS